MINIGICRQVLEDGSVVHINKTVIADTDEAGNSFFFHRAVFHNIGNSEDSVNSEDSEDSEDSEANDANEAEEETVEEVSDLSNEEEDPEDDPETGIDDGLLA